MRRVIALVVALAIAAPAVAFAQQAAEVDASKMGVDLSRIKRELADTAEETDADDPLKLRLRVEVVGTAPKIDFLEGFRVDGPVPYGPPTHAEVLHVLTPKEFRTPAFPVYGLAVLAAQKLHSWNKKRACEAEIEEYRRLVMSGVAVAAPRCSQ